MGNLRRCGKLITESLAKTQSTLLSNINKDGESHDKGIGYALSIKSSFCFCGKNFIKQVTSRLGDDGFKYVVSVYSKMTLNTIDTK